MYFSVKKIILATLMVGSGFLLTTCFQDNKMINYVNYDKKEEIDLTNGLTPEYEKLRALSWDRWIKDPSYNGHSDTPEGLAYFYSPDLWRDGYGFIIKGYGDRCDFALAWYLKNQKTILAMARKQPQYVDSTDISYDVTFETLAQYEKTIKEREDGNDVSYRIGTVVYREDIPNKRFIHEFGCRDNFGDIFDDSMIIDLTKEKPKS
jgi:hypothetical protein